MKCIFLDFDGVINNWNHFTGVSEDNARVLKHIIKLPQNIKNVHKFVEKRQFLFVLFNMTRLTVFILILIFN